MQRVRKLTHRVVNRIVNRPSEVKKRAYLKLRARLEPLRAPEAQRVQTEKPVLIISGISMQGTGIFCNLLAFLRWVYFAELMGYAPVIDMQNVPNLYLEEGLAGVNSYEYFYRQPSDMTLEQAYRAKEVYFVNRLDCPYDFSLRQKWMYRKATAVSDWVYGENREKHFALYKRLYDTYFVPSEEAQAFAQAQWERLVPQEGMRTLGLLCRGTDYFAKRPYAHQIQPTAEQIIAKTEEFLGGHEIDRIVVATEDEQILSALAERFGARVVYIDCPRLTARAGQSVAEGFAERRVDKRLNGLYYFASIACLSRCDHLIAGKTMATQFIRTMRDTDFESEFYWNLGRYGITDKK